MNRGRHLLVALVLIASVYVGGCAAVRTIANIASAAPVKAQFVPPKKPTVVIVRDRPDPMGHGFAAEGLTQRLEQELAQRDIVPVVPSVEIASLRSSRPAEFAAASSAALARAVGAQQIISVSILSSRTGAGEGNDLLKGQITATVSVIDAVENRTLWPTDGTAGATVTYSTPMMRENEDVNTQSLQMNLDAGLADRIARLFYMHEPEY